MNQRTKWFLRQLLPRTVTPQRIWGGPLRGLRIVTSWFDYPAAILGYTEPRLLEWFKRNVHPGETWLDVGAHYGYTALALSSLVGPAGRVFAFEPVLATAGFLSQTRRLNRLPQLTVLPLALGDPVEFELKQLALVRGMVDSTQSVAEWTETILVTRLDRVWSHICGEHEQVDGVKIDVQGMELATLRGMSELLNTFKPKLVIEVHHGTDRREFLDLLSTLGYSHQGVPTEPIHGETEPQYVDDRSYAFQAPEFCARRDQAE